MIIQKFFHANLKELYMDFNKHEQSPQIYSVGKTAMRDIGLVSAKGWANH